MRSPKPADASPEAIVETLALGGRVRRALTPEGIVHIDRLLPFLCVYRRPHGRQDEGTERIVRAEASYLVATGEPRGQGKVRALVKEISALAAERFGAAMVLEVWASEAPDPADQPDGPAVARPAFRIHAARSEDGDRFIDIFEQALSRVGAKGQSVEVGLVRSGACAPPGARPLLTRGTLPPGVRLLGLEVEAFYQSPDSGRAYPLIVRGLLRSLTRALRRIFFEFTRSYTTQRPGNYHVLGRRSMVKAVWEVDRRLADVADGFDFLLQVTPTNGEAAWREFKRRDFERAPVLHYRPLPVDPVLLKRKLWEAPVLKLEDPALTHLFRDKQDELDRQLTMLLDIDTPRFLHGSLQLHGPVDDDLLRLAERILDAVRPRSRERSAGPPVPADEFARRAAERVAALGEKNGAIRVEVRDDISGILVSGSSLLIGAGLRVAASRVEALIAHEVGTHLLTWHNGHAQPLRQLACGLAGYEALQEGLAVLAEYLVGGLSPARLRTLAGRVVAARGASDGATFVDTFRDLHRNHGFGQREAFSMTLRIHRGGGFVKDAIYLDGLQRLIDYLRAGGELDPLFAGKIALEHVGLVRELEMRSVLKAPDLRPWYLDAPEARMRLARVRELTDVLELIRRSKK